MPRIFKQLEAGCLQVNLMSTSAQINQLKYTIPYRTVPFRTIPYYTIMYWKNELNGIANRIWNNFPRLAFGLYFRRLPVYILDE